MVVHHELSFEVSVLSVRLKRIRSLISGVFAIDIFTSEIKNEPSTKCLPSLLSASLM